jgi:hypothetical protein
MSTINENNNLNPIRNNKKEIIKTWLAGACSCTLVIPKEFAKDYGLDKPAHVLLEKKQEGILIRKLVL